jgi:hypothetical protein
MTGYILTTATSTDYIYDIGAVTFSNLVTTQLAPWVGTLSTLRSSVGTMTPAFNSSVTDYQVVVPAATATVTVTPTATSAGEILLVNGTPVATGVASAAISIATSPTVSVIATSADGTSSTYYTITYVRQGLTPTFAARTSTNTGINSSISNYNPLYTYSFTSTAGAVVQGTPTATALPFSVVGLYQSQPVTVTVRVSRVGYSTTTASFTATALATVLLMPLFDTPVPTNTGFTVNVTNYYRPAGTPTYTWSYGASAGYTAVAGPAVGSIVPVTVSGAQLTGQSPVLTVTTTRTGSATSGVNTISVVTIASVGIQSLVKGAPKLAAPVKTIKAKAKKLKATKK